MRGFFVHGGGRRLCLGFFWDQGSAFPWDRAVQIPLNPMHRNGSVPGNDRLLSPLPCGPPGIKNG